MPSLRHTKKFIAAYVACGGRMHLYADPDKQGKRALYCDTDSFIFVQKDGEPLLIQCSNALGEMTSELQENEYISEFFSGSP